ncbi:MAG: hypothetical protein NUW00_04000, partial [Candidatus Kaiserbacteria bacterium]|nr:hypothetical protein [Candidatus Kaiserbacteria bacterium]
MGRIKENRINCMKENCTEEATIFEVWSTPRILDEDTFAWYTQCAPLSFGSFRRSVLGVRYITKEE